MSMFCKERLILDLHWHRKANDKDLVVS
jgi:hypothetical protein